MQPGPPLDSKKLPTDADPVEEAFMHTPRGFHKEGRPMVAECNRVGTLQLLVVDEADGKPTFCRVNVIGPDGNTDDYCWK